MKRYLSVILLFSVVTLVGCKTDAELRAMEQAKADAQDAKDNQECLSYGSKVGSSEYVSCRLKLKEIRQSATNASTMAPPAQGWKKSSCVVEGNYVTCF